jgi:hypothetical protein
MVPERMALSSDPDKRARQLANLRQGPAAAEKAFGLPVVPYADDPPPVAASSKPAPRKAKAEVREPPAQDAAPEGGDTMLWVGVAAAGLLVLILFMSRTGGRDGG